MRWVICASGPSVARTDFDLLQASGWNVMAVNNTWELLPWAQAMYAGDRQWWDRYGADCTFEGKRYTADQFAARRYRCQHITRRAGFGLSTVPGVVHSGGNSGFQAVNLVYQLGAKRIVLLGFDMHRREAGHWHGDHEGMLSAPENHLRRWVRAFAPLADDLRRHGVHVVNSTPGSALTCITYRPLERALKR